MDNKTATIIAVAAVIAILVIGGVGVAISGMLNSNDDTADYVNYYGNGGKDSQGKDTVKSKVLEVLACPFSNEGKTFSDWNTKADGTGDKIDIGDTVKLGTKLYAQWSDKKLTINNITYMFINLTMWKGDEKITTFEIPLDNSGEVTISYKGWNDVTISSSDDKKVTFAGHVTVYGISYNTTLKLDIDGADKCDFSVEGGNVAVMKIKYSGNVTIN